MNNFSLEAAELINTAMRLVALNGIYRTEDRHAAAQYLRENCTQDTDAEPDEETAMVAIVTMLSDEPPAPPTLSEAARETIWKALYETAHNGQSRDWFFAQLETALSKTN